MQRLSGLDAGFLYMETRTLHMHTLKVAVVDPSTVPGGYTFERFKEVLEERLHLLPPFRRRLVMVPLGLHHPLWIEDAGFDLDDHVGRIGVPPPGTRREMDEMISLIASTLDRDRPSSIQHLRGLREERKAVITVTDGWPLYQPDRNLAKPLIDPKRTASSRADRRRCRYRRLAAIRSRDASPPATPAPGR